MFAGLGTTVNSLFLTLHILWKRRKAVWMSNSVKYVHPMVILCSHHFIGNFYIKGISFLSEALRQTGQAITAGMFLCSPLEYGGVSIEGTLPGGRSSWRGLVLHAQKWAHLSFRRSLCLVSCLLRPWRGGAFQCPWNLCLNLVAWASTCLGIQ